MTGGFLTLRTQLQDICPLLGACIMKCSVFLRRSWVENASLSVHSRERFAPGTSVHFL